MNRFFNHCIKIFVKRALLNFMTLKKLTRYSLPDQISPYFVYGFIPGHPTLHIPV